MNMKFDSSSLESDLANFEHEISRYELESGSKVDDGVKIATLINGTSGPPLEWIRLRAPDNDWRAIRNQVVGYARTMSFDSTMASTSSSMSGPAPMEIGAVWGKGKGKGKGKVEGKGKDGKGQAQPS